MNDIQKMFQAVIHGQNAIKQELSGKIDKVDQKLEKLGKRLEGRIDQVEENLTQRIDNLGKQLAYLEEDTPTN